MKWKLVSISALLSLPIILTGCVVQRTVTDGSGETIYQEPEIHTPFESTEKRNAEVQKREQELGW